MTQPTSSPPGRSTRATAQMRPARRRRSWASFWGRLAVFLPLAVFLTSSIIYLTRVYNLIRVDLTPIVASEASRELGREVVLGRLSLYPLGTITLEHFR